MRKRTVAAVTAGTLLAAPVAQVAPSATAAPPAPALILSVEDVRVISGNADLVPGEQVDSPGGQHQYDAQFPAECHPVFDQDAAFAGGFTEFRSVTYTGAASRAVTQAVAVYPDSFAARDALTAVGKSLRACSELGPASSMAVTTQVLDQKTFALCQTQCSTLYRAAGPVLISVSASRFGDSDRVATAVLARISTRVGE